MIFFIFLLLALTTGALLQSTSDYGGYWHALQDSDLDTLNWNLRAMLLYVVGEAKYDHSEARNVCMNLRMTPPMSNLTEISQIWSDKVVKVDDIFQFSDDWGDPTERKPFICTSLLQGVLLVHRNGRSEHLDLRRDWIPWPCYPQMDFDFEDYDMKDLVLCMLIRKKVLL